MNWIAEGQACLTLAFTVVISNFVGRVSFKALGVKEYESAAMVVTFLAVVFDAIYLNWSAPTFTSAIAALFVALVFQRVSTKKEPSS